MISDQSSWEVPARSVLVGFWRYYVYLCNMPLHSPPQKLLFPVNQAIESIFSPKNIDTDCDTISRLMLPVENAIEQYLFDGDFACAVSEKLLVYLILILNLM